MRRLGISLRSSAIHNIKYQAYMIPSEWAANRPSEHIEGVSDVPAFPSLQLPQRVAQIDLRPARLLIELGRVSSRGRCRASRSNVMTVSEYEERFRFSAPSLHETFVAMQGSGPRRRRRQRFWAAVALAGGIIAANEVAPYQSAHDVTHSASQMAHSAVGSTPISPAGR